MAVEKLFKSRMLSCQYFFEDGARADFVSGRYSTADDAKIAQLELEIKNNHPHIYVDDNEVEVDTDKLDPLEHLRAKFIAEYLAAQQAKEGTNFGTTGKQGNAEVGSATGIMTSAKIVEGAKESLSASIKVGTK